MAFTKIVSPGIDTTGSYTVQELNTVGVMTAGTVQVGSATTVHTTGIDLGSGNITSHNINSTGIITATSFVGPVSATNGTFSGNVSIGGTLTYEDVTNIDSVGIITARQGIDTDTVRGKTNNSNMAIGARASNGAFVQTITIKPDRSVGLGNITNPTSILDVRQTNTGAATEIKLFNLDQSNATTQTAALVMTPDLRANGVKIVAVKEVADMSSSANKDLALTFQTVANNTAAEKLRITSAGQMGLGTNDPNSYGGNVKLAVANTSGTCGLSIVSATNGDGNLYYADGTSGDATYRGYIRYNHTLDQFRIGMAGAERLRITPTTASVSSTGNGANGIGCVGIDDNSPDSRALALSIGGGSGVYGIEDPRPLVYLQRSYGIGGGSSTDETTLEVNAPGSYNSAGIVYGIKSRAQHNLNGSHYAGHFEAHGSQYSANGTSALYAKTTKLDTNGGGDVIAFRADASITQGSSNSGAAIAGYFASGNNVNGKPIVCQNGYTTNSYSNQIIFRKHNGSGIVDVGTIKSNNTSTQYNTSSDYRLKENIVSLTGAIDRLKQLQPKRFNFIGIDETIDGFIAHEVNPVAPYAVSGEKDAVKKELVLDEDGKEQFDENGEIIEREVIDPQGVDYSKLTTLTIAALQEALAKIETLEAAVAALQGS